MEDFEEIKPDLLSSNPLEVDEDSGYFLMEAGTWAKAIAIISCALVLILIGGVSVLIGSNIFSKSSGLGIGIMLALLLILGLLLVFVINLFRFNKGMQDGVEQQDAKSFEQGIDALKNYFIFVGILSILMAITYIIKALY